jgi:hypothetical protein
MQRAVGKAAGDECVFIPGRGLGRQIGTDSDAMLDVASGEVGHRTVRLDGTIHGYIFDQRIIGRIYIGYVVRKGSNYISTS